MFAIALGLVSSLTYGFADFAGGMSARGAHALRVSIIATPVNLAIALLAIPFLGAQWNAGALQWGAVAGVSEAAAVVLLYATLARGPMSILSPITALVSEVIPVAVGLGVGERLHPTGIAGLPLSVVAVLLLSAARDATRRRPSVSVLLMALGAGTAIGLQLIALNEAPANSGVAPLAVSRVMAAVILLGAAFIRRGQLGTAMPSLPLSALAGALDSLANLFFLYAVRHGPLAVIAVLTALYPAGTLLLARLVLHERLTRAQAGGLCLAGAAVVLLALSG